MIRVGEMRNMITAVFLTGMLPGLAFAQGAMSYQCTQGDLIRRVEIFHETGVPVPCEVQYFKDTEAPGERQVLWRAINEVGYCERKTEAFIAQLREWGWDCGQKGAEAPVEAESEPAEESEQAEEPEQADDTEALVPVEEAEPAET